MERDRPRIRTSTKEAGQQAELLAAEHLKRHGYHIIEKNFACKLGEIDIIARHKGELVFVEVRSRNCASAPDPAYSVTPRKQRRIIRAASLYLLRHFPTPPPSRFDVVVVTLTDPPDVEVIADAFWAS